MKPLEEYSRKRNFRRTPEPGPKLTGGSAAKGAIFVVQEHHASHLHYDFRLEVDGVLRSWAVPKGPSLDPKQKRLAVEVEDHPLDYAKFEGRIPEGEYGGGDVILWDNGRWEPEGEPDEGLKKGKLEFQLQGKKLKGRWLLLRTGKKGKGSRWLLIKSRDRFAAGEEQGPLAGSRRTAKGVSPRPRTESLQLTSPERNFLGEKFTMGKVAQFYAAVAPWMFPHLERRPLSILRCLEGVGGKCFLQKGVGKEAPPFAEKIGTKEAKGQVDYLPLSSVPGFLSRVQKGTLEFHASNCRSDAICCPDQIVMDLDPGPGVGWRDTVRAAIDLRDILERLGLESFVKLSGKKGLHLHVPIIPVYGWSQVLAFSRAVALEMASRDPGIYTVNSEMAKRKHNVFLNYLRNV